MPDIPGPMSKDAHSGGKTFGGQKSRPKKFGTTTNSTAQMEKAIKAMKFRPPKFGKDVKSALLSKPKKKEE